jgi:dienelactone hydrolase
VKNLSDTGGYRFFDHVMAQAVRSLSRLLGVKNILFPFWNRWRASLIGEKTLMHFLDSIRTIDDWPVVARRIVERDDAEIRSRWDSLSPAEQVQHWRRASMLYHMAQWGCIPLSDEKRLCYQRSRDCYVQAEQLAHGPNYRRLPIDWTRQRFWANLHLPAGGPGPWPLLVIVHGMDDTKEEHLATELYAQQHGLAVCGIDGPGQGEALFLDGVKWTARFADFLSQVISTLCADGSCDPRRVGLVGISWGGLWAIKTAARDPRVGAVYDLGGPIDARGFDKLPFFLKSKFCQVLGVTGPRDIRDAEEMFSLKQPPDQLAGVVQPVRIVHGARDPLVPVADKVWLRDQLRSLHPGQDVSLIIHPRGDHCCTGEAAELRRDLVDWFRAVLASPRAAGRLVAAAGGLS